MELECDLSKINNEELLRKMWQQSEDSNRKKEIRSQLYKLRELRLKDLYQGDIMADHTVAGFGKDPLVTSHGDALVDQSFQSMKSKEIRDSLSPTEMKFQSMALNNPNTTGWNVQSSKEVSPDGRGFRAETVATTDGVENINGGIAEFKGRNEQQSSAHHQGDDKNFVKKAMESSNSHLQEKVVIGDENSGRTEVRTSSSTSTSSSKVIQSSTNVEYEDDFPLQQQIRHPQNLQQRQQLEQEQQFQQQHLEQQERRNLEQVSTTRQNTQQKNISQNTQTQETHEQNKRYVDMDKASPEYQQHVQYLMQQPGEIISNTVEYPKPNVKMITTVKRLPDGTIVRNKRYETEELTPSTPSAPSARPTTTPVVTNQTPSTRRDSQPNNYQPTSSPRAAKLSQDMVDSSSIARHHQNTYADDVETKFSAIKKSSRKFSTETTSETIQEEYDDHHSQAEPILRAKPKTNDFSTHGFPSVRANKPTQEYPTERPHNAIPHSSILNEAVVPHYNDNIDNITERRINTKDGEVIIVSSEKKHNFKTSTNSERIVETEHVVRDDQIPDKKALDFTTHGSPSASQPLRQQPRNYANEKQDFPLDKSPHTTRITKGDDEMVVVSSQKSHTAKHSSNTEHVIEHEIIRDDRERNYYPRLQQPNSTNYTVTTPGAEQIPQAEYPGSPKKPGNVDYSTQGFPSVRTPAGERESYGDYPAGSVKRPSNDYSTQGYPSVKTATRPAAGLPSSHNQHPHSPRKSPNKDYSTQGFPSVRTPSKETPTQGYPSNGTVTPTTRTPSPGKYKPVNTTIRETTERVIRKEKEVDSAHRAFAASLRSSSPLEHTRRDSYTTDSHTRHTPRSSVSSTRTFRRDTREGSHDSAPSETSRISTTTVTRNTPPRGVATRTLNAASPRATKSPSPAKNGITTTTTRTLTSKDVPKVTDNQHTRITTNQIDKKFPINEPTPLISITKSKFSDNHKQPHTKSKSKSINLNNSNNKMNVTVITEPIAYASSASAELKEVIEPLCIRKNYTKLGPSVVQIPQKMHSNATIETKPEIYEKSPTKKPAPNSRSRSSTPSYNSNRKLPTTAEMTDDHDDDDNDEKLPSLSSPKSKTPQKNVPYDNAEPQNVWEMTQQPVNDEQGRTVPTGKSNNFEPLNVEWIIVDDVDNYDQSDHNDDDELFAQLNSRKIPTKQVVAAAVPQRKTKPLTNTVTTTTTTKTVTTKQLRATPSKTLPSKSNEPKTPLKIKPHDSKATAPQARTQKPLTDTKSPLKTPTKVLSKSTYTSPLRKPLTKPITKETAVKKTLTKSSNELKDKSSKLIEAEKIKRKSLAPHVNSVERQPKVLQEEIEIPPKTQPEEFVKTKLNDDQAKIPQDVEYYEQPFYEVSIDFQPPLGDYQSPSPNSIDFYKSPYPADKPQKDPAGGSKPLDDDKHPLSHPLDSYEPTRANDDDDNNRYAAEKPQKEPAGIRKPPFDMPSTLDTNSMSKPKLPAVFRKTPSTGFQKLQSAFDERSPQYGKPNVINDACDDGDEEEKGFKQLQNTVDDKQFMIAPNTQQPQREMGEEQTTLMEETWLRKHSSHEQPKPQIDATTPGVTSTQLPDYEQIIPNIPENINEPYQSPTETRKPIERDNKYAQNIHQEEIRTTETFEEESSKKRSHSPEKKKPFTICNDNEEQPHTTQPEFETFEANNDDDDCDYEGMLATSQKIVAKHIQKFETDFLKIKSPKTPPKQPIQIHKKVQKPPVKETCCPKFPERKVSPIRNQKKPDEPYLTRPSYSPSDKRPKSPTKHVSPVRSNKQTHEVILQQDESVKTTEFSGLEYPELKSKDHKPLTENPQEFISNSTRKFLISENQKTDLRQQQRQPEQTSSNQLPTKMDIPKSSNEKIIGDFTGRRTPSPNKHTSPIRSGQKKPHQNQILFNDDQTFRETLRVTENINALPKKNERPVTKTKLNLEEPTDTKDEESITETCEFVINLAQKQQTTKPCKKEKDTKELPAKRVPSPHKHNSPTRLQVKPNKPTEPIEDVKSFTSSSKITKIVKEQKELNKDNKSPARQPIEKRPKSPSKSSSPTRQPKQHNRNEETYQTVKEYPSSTDYEEDKINTKSFITSKTCHITDKLIQEPEYSQQPLESLNRTSKKLSTPDGIFVTTTITQKIEDHESYPDNKQESPQNAKALETEKTASEEIFVINSSKTQNVKESVILEPFKQDFTVTPTPKATQATPNNPPDEDIFLKTKKTFKTVDGNDNEIGPAPEKPYNDAKNKKTTLPKEFIPRSIDDEQLLRSIVTTTKTITETTTKVKPTEINGEQTFIETAEFVFQPTNKPLHPGLPESITHTSEFVRNSAQKLIETEQQTFKVTDLENRKLSTKKEHSSTRIPGLIKDEQAPEHEKHTAHTRPTKKEPKVITEDTETFKKSLRTTKLDKENSKRKQKKNTENDTDKETETETDDDKFVNDLLTESCEHDYVTEQIKTDEKTQKTQQPTEQDFAKRKESPLKNKPFTSTYDNEAYETIEAQTYPEDTEQFPLREEPWILCKPTAAKLAINVNEEFISNERKRKETPDGGFISKTIEPATPTSPTYKKKGAGRSDTFEERCRQILGMDNYGDTQGCYKKDTSNEIDNRKATTTTTTTAVINTEDIKSVTEKDTKVFHVKIEDCDEDDESFSINSVKKTLHKQIPNKTIHSSTQQPTKSKTIKETLAEGQEKPITSSLSKTEPLETETKKKLSKKPTTCPQRSSSPIKGNTTSPRSLSPTKGVASKKEFQKPKTLQKLDDDETTSKTIKDRLRSSTRKLKSPAKGDQLDDSASSPERSPTRFNERRRSSNISVTTEIIIEHTDSDTPFNKENSPKKSKDSVFKDIIDSTVLPEKLIRRMPVTERKESAPVHRVTSREKDTKMSRSTSENLIKVKKSLSPETSSTKTTEHRRPNKCFATKSINLSATADRLINSGRDMENVIIDIQHAKSSREPSPDKIVPTPVPAHLDTGKPRYPDVVQEPDEEHIKRKPQVNNIPIFEEDTNTFIGCHITEINNEESKHKTNYDARDYCEEEILKNPVVEAPASLDYKTLDEENLLCVHENISKFQSLNTEIELQKKHENVEQEYLVTELLTKGNNEFAKNENVYTTTKLAATAPQKSPELVRSISKNISKQNEPTTSTDFNVDDDVDDDDDGCAKGLLNNKEFKVSHQLTTEKYQQPYDGNDDHDDVDDELIPHTAEHTTILEERRQKDILSRPSVFEGRNKTVATTTTKTPLKYNKSPVKDTEKLRPDNKSHTNKPTSAPTSAVTTTQTKQNTTTMATSSSSSSTPLTKTQTKQLPQRKNSDIDYEFHGSSNVETGATKNIISKQPTTTKAYNSSSCINSNSTSTNICDSKTNDLKMPNTGNNKKPETQHTPVRSTPAKNSDDEHDFSPDNDDEIIIKVVNEKINIDTEKQVVNEKIPLTTTTAKVIPQKNQHSSTNNSSTTEQPLKTKIIKEHVVKLTDKNPNQANTVTSTSTSLTSKIIKKSPTEFTLDDIDDTVLEPNKPATKKIPSQPQIKSNTTTSSSTKMSTKTATDSVAAKRSLFESNVNSSSSIATTHSKRTPLASANVSNSRRPSYMEHTKSSLEHTRRDSIEINKTNYLRKPSQQSEEDTHFNQERNSMVKFEVPQTKRITTINSSTQQTEDINVEEIFDLEILEKLLETVQSYEIRRRIRAQIRLIKKNQKNELISSNTEVKSNIKTADNEEMDAVTSTTVTSSSLKKPIPEGKTVSGHKNEYIFEEAYHPTTRRSPKPNRYVHEQERKQHSPTHSPVVCKRNAEHERRHHSPEHAEHQTRTITCYTNETEQVQQEMPRDSGRSSPHKKSVSPISKPHSISSSPERGSPRSRSPQMKSTQLNRISSSRSPDSKTFQQQKHDDHDNEHEQKQKQTHYTSSPRGRSPQMKPQQLNRVSSSRSPDSKTLQQQKHYDYDNEHEQQLEQTHYTSSPRGRSPQMKSPQLNRVSSSRSPDSKTLQQQKHYDYDNEDEQQQEQTHYTSSSRSRSPQKKSPQLNRVSTSRSPDSKTLQQRKHEREHEQETVKNSITKRTTTTTRKSSKPDDKTPVWADRKNILKAPPINSSTGTALDSRAGYTKTIKSTTTTTKQKLSSNNNKSSSLMDNDDCVISSYGIGPTDENGLPLFGIRALKKKKPPTTVEPSETTEEVTGYVVEEKYYSDNKTKPKVERKELIYSTNPEELEKLKQQVEVSTHRKALKDVELKESRQAALISKACTTPPALRASPEDDFLDSTTKYVRRGSVKEMSEKFIQKETAATVQLEKSNNYPKAGLILRTNSRKSSHDIDNENEHFESYKTTKVQQKQQHHTSSTLLADSDDNEQEYEVEEVSSRHSGRFINESESECESIKTQREFKKIISSSTTSSATAATRSFLNSQGEEKVITNVSDCLQRMRNADNVVEEGDTAEDQEARALLNKFLGASIIMKGVESSLPAANRQSKIITTTTTSNSNLNDDNHDGDNNAKHEVKTTRITKTIKSGSSSTPVTYTTCDIEEIWDEAILKELLEQARTYEERRKIRSRLRELMADREETKKSPQGEDNETTAATTPSPAAAVDANVPAQEEEESASEYEEIIEEITDYSEAESELNDNKKPNKNLKESSDIEQNSSSVTKLEEKTSVEPKLQSEIQQLEVTKSVTVEVAPTETFIGQEVDNQIEKGECPKQQMVHNTASQSTQNIMPQEINTQNNNQKLKSLPASVIETSSMYASFNNKTQKLNSTAAPATSQSKSIVVTQTVAGRTDSTSLNNKNNKNNISNDSASGSGSGSLGVVVGNNNNSNSSPRQDRLGVPQKEDSGTESGEDLRLIAAGLRDQLQIQTDSNIIEDVTCALSRLENSLKEGKDISVDIEKRKALLALVARLRAGLTSPEKLAEIAAAMSELDRSDGMYGETSSPEADAHRSTRSRFGKRRNRVNRHTVGVSREELADARRYMEDMLIISSMSQSTTPEANAMPNNSPPQWYPLEKNASTGAILTQPLTPVLQRPKQFVAEETANNTTYTNRLTTNNGKRRPHSGEYSVSFEKPEELKLQSTEKGSPACVAPEDNSKSSRFTNKKHLMKRANTIDLAKTRKYNPELDTDSDAEDKATNLGLKRAVQVSVKKRVQNVVPPFEPKTENDRKFLAFINKQSDRPGLGWTTSRSVSNWTNKFGSIKSTFEGGLVGKPPQPPQHVSTNTKSQSSHKLFTQSVANNVASYQASNHITNQQIAQRLQQEAERQTDERRRKLEKEHLEYERRERDKLERQRQQRERQERERLEREHFERQRREQDQITAAQHAAILREQQQAAPNMSIPQPIAINEFKHAPQSVFRPIDLSEASSKLIYKPIPQLPRNVGNWQSVNATATRTQANNLTTTISPAQNSNTKPDNSFITSPPPSSRSPIVLPWASKPTVDNSSFKSKTHRFEERSKYDNINATPSSVQRHNSLRSSNDNHNLDDFRKRPSLPNAFDNYNAVRQMSSQHDPLAYLPPPQNISFTYSSLKPKSTYQSYPCLPSAVVNNTSNHEYQRLREDSLTDPKAVPLVLTSSYSSYYPSTQSMAQPQPSQTRLLRQFDLVSSTGSAPASPSIYKMQQNDFTDDDLDSDSNLLEYRAVSRVMSKPQVQTAVTVGRRTGHISDDELYGKNSRAAKNLLNTMKSLGNSRAPVVKNSEPSATRKTCLSPDGRSYQAPIVKPLFPEVNKFEANRKPLYTDETKQQTSVAPARTQFGLYKSMENLNRAPPKNQTPLHKPYVNETQAAYVVTYPMEDTTDDEDLIRHNQKKMTPPNSLDLRRHRNVSENSSGSSTTTSMTYSHNLPSPNTNWTANPIVSDEKSNNYQNTSQNNHKTLPSITAEPTYQSHSSVITNYSNLNQNYKSPPLDYLKMATQYNDTNQRYTMSPPQQQQHQITRQSQTPANAASTSESCYEATAVKQMQHQVPVQTVQKTNTQQQVTEKYSKPDVTQKPVNNTKQTSTKTITQEKWANLRTTDQQSAINPKHSNISKEMLMRLDQQRERISNEMRRKSLENTLDYQMEKEARYEAQNTQQVYKSSAPADTPDIVKSSLPKDETQPILKKFGPPQRHNYMPNSYQSPTTNTTSSVINTAKLTSKQSVIKKTTQQLQTLGGNTRPTIMETPATPQPDDDYIPRNIVYNNVHAFSSMSRRQEEENNIRPNKLSKSDSWNQIMMLQNQYQTSNATKFNQNESPTNDLRRTKSGHTLALPKMFEAAITKTDVSEKQKTVAAYFSGTKSPIQQQETIMEQLQQQQQQSTKRTVINRTKTSEKVSAASRKSLGSNLPIITGGLQRSATMPHIANLNLLDESNVEDAFEQLIMEQKQQKSSSSTTEKTETKEKDGAIVTTTTKVTTHTVTGSAAKPASPFAKFKQLDKQHSAKSPTTSTKTTVGGTTASPTSVNQPIFKFTDPALNAKAATVKEQLLQWCQSKTQEYENIEITNFSTSWNNGLAFCALIHHFLPDAFDYNQLTPKNRRKNFELAFTVADEKAGIAPLLDVEDMVVMQRPDWKCVFVYVQSIYRRFRNCQ